MSDVLYISGPPTVKASVAWRYTEAEMKEIAVTEYETPSGHVGYRACAPKIPGCVVIHFDPTLALYLVHVALMAMNDEPTANDVSDEIAMLSHRSV